jgi:site-specific recombinase XerD
VDQPHATLAFVHLAGHADIGTTANIYSHLDTSDLETALRTLNEETG